MAVIPLGNFGNVMPQAQSGRVLDTGAGHVAQAAGQLGQVGQQVAVKQLNEEQKIQDEKDEYFFSTQAAKYGAEYTDVVTDTKQRIATGEFNELSAKAHLRQRTDELNENYRQTLPETKHEKFNYYSEKVFLESETNIKPLAYEVERKAINTDFEEVTEATLKIENREQGFALFKNTLERNPVLTPEQRKLAPQQWNERRDLSDGKTALNALETAKDVEGLQQLHDNIDTVLPHLKMETRDAFKNNIQSTIERINKGLQVDQDKALREIKQEATDFRTDAYTGYPITPERVEAVLNKVKGTEYEAQVREDLALNKDAQKFRDKSPIEQEREITRLTSQLENTPQEDASLLQKQLSMYQGIANTSKQRSKDDPIAQIQSQTGTQLQTVKPEEIGTGKIDFKKSHITTEILAKQKEANGAGVATSVGLSTRASEHSRLTQQFGVDQDTADTVSNMGGVAMAALTFVPMSNVFKSGLVDYAATVGGTTLAGQVLQYGQGEVLENSGHTKVGEMYKDMATDPTMILTNLGLGSAFWALGRMRTDPTKTQAEIEQAEVATYDAVDQAIADADRSSIPTQPETAGDMLRHEANLNQAIDQVMKGEKVNISEATGGQLKTLDDVKNYIQNKNTTNNKPINTTNKKNQSLAEATEYNKKVIWEKLNPGMKYPTPKTQAKPFTATGTQKRIYDEAKANGLTDADAKVVVALAHFESGGSFSPTVKNKSSSATGVFQFIDGTWKAEGGTSANRHDLNTQIKLGIQHTKKNIKYIEDKTGVTLTGSQIYVPHLLGIGGAEHVFKAIKENPNQLARDVIARFSKDPDHLMKINGIPKNARIDDAVHFFTKKIDALAAQHYGAESSLSATRVADDAEATVLTEDLTRPTQDLDTTVPRTDLDTFPDLTTDYIGKADVDAFTARHTVSEDPFADITADMVNLLDDFDLLKLGEAPKRTVEEDAQFSKELNEILEAFNTEVEHAPIPHTSKGIQVKDRVNDPAKEFKPDQSIATEWTKSQRFEDKKYHDQLTRTYKDQNGHTVQEMQYKGTYLKRVVNDAHQTDFIHVGRSNKSDFVDHKGNKELETALDRIFEDRSFGYLSQIPKGQEAITKLKDNPNLVISSKKTGEDLTAQQWQQKLQREQDNIQMMTKAMSTLAKCALKQVA